jgi:site-specific DNA recombinase
MWIGGCPPLGYDAKDRNLVVNPAEAEPVRLIFRRLLDLGSTLLLIRELNAPGSPHQVLDDERGPLS